MPAFPAYRSSRHAAFQVAKSGNLPGRSGQRARPGNGSPVFAKVYEVERGKTRLYGLHRRYGLCNSQLVMETGGRCLTGGYPVPRMPASAAGA